MDFNVLKEKPFYLKDEDIQWISTTLNEMSLEEKIGQLFCLIAYDDNEAYLNELMTKYKPGGVMCRPMEMEPAIHSVKTMQAYAKIPLLISANLEKGGNGVVNEGTSFGSQMMVAATDEVEYASKLGKVCAREGGAIGVNWAFAPIIDIDYNFRNPITNTRTLGSDPERVSKMGRAYVEALQKEGVAASIKHFPGDGRDERDQHLVTSINDMTCEDWDKTYGEAYKNSIDAGALTAMIGHIMQPAYSKALNPALSDNDILPASLSTELLNGLLRGKLGFNGMIVSDASTMAGMTIPMERSKAVPACIAAGCDMFLFARNIDEDYEYMKKGIEDGVITQERLEEALARILATKASLGLHNNTAAVSLEPDLEKAKAVIGSKENKEWAAGCIDKAITLVKEEKGVLPISPEKYKRVLMYGIEADPGFFNSIRQEAPERVKKMLEDEGFEVTMFKPAKGFEGSVQAFRDISDNYDLIIYIANLSTKSNQTIVRLEWAQPMGANVPIYMQSVPTIFVSLENPYHLLDVPRVRTYINTYSSTDAALELLVEKLSGKSEFKGISPSDPFCGRWDTKLS